MLSSCFGNKIIYSLFGESHGSHIGITLHNLPSGQKIDINKINQELNRRRPHGDISTSRIEKDNYQIISGAIENITTGAPLTILIENDNTNSKSYDKYTPRASHSDYPAYIKYGGHNDFRGGGTFSGRVTVALVIAGSIIQQLLAEKEIYIGSHIYSIQNQKDIKFNNIDKSTILRLHQSNFPTLSQEAENLMKKAILDAKSQGDSLGGIIETFVIGLPVGVGEPFFDSLESTISRLIFSIPGIKGISFGDGFDITTKFGSQSNDELYIHNDEIKTYTNNNGGINGGLSNGMPIYFKTAIRPTPTIFKEYSTINLENYANVTKQNTGRHDPCIVHRVAPIIDAVTAIAIYELLGE